MPKFLVCLARLKREETTVSVEAESMEQVVENMKELYDEAEELDQEWVEDFEWGGQMSDSCYVSGELEDSDNVDFIVTKDGVSRKEEG